MFKPSKIKALCTVISESFREKKVLNHGRKYSKEIKFGHEVRRLMLQGVDVLADSVALTMGPKGRNVIFEERKGIPRVTKDGYTVAKQIKLNDRFQNIGSQLVLAVADSANTEAGDGTSTATVLARAIAREAYEAVMKGKNPNEIRKGIKMAVECVNNELKGMSRPIGTAEEIMQIATISSGGDELIGQMISNAVEKVGKKGLIRITNAREIDDKLEIVEGFQFEKGFISPYFTNSGNGSKIVLKDCYVLLVDKKISSAKPLIPCLEIVRKKDKPLLIIAEDITGEALVNLLMNKLHNGMRIAAVKAPAFGVLKTELMHDIAVATGATLFSDEEVGALVSHCKEYDLGRTGEIVITNKDTILMKYKGEKEKIASRVNELTERLKTAKDDAHADQLHERIAKLTSGIAIIKVGGISEAELNCRKDRYIDAINATKSALEDGIIPGCGTALIKSIPILDSLKPNNPDQLLGINVIKSALKTPCLTIIKNANVEDPSIIVEKVLKEPKCVGYDVMTNKLTDLIKKGVIDSTKVVMTALEKAASVASLLATAEAVILNDSKDKLKKKIAQVSGKM